MNCIKKKTIYNIKTNTKTIKMITENQKETLNKKNLQGLENAYIKACTENNVELAEYILFSNELKHNPAPECKNYQALRDAANQGAFEMIEFLLNHPQINRKEELIKARKQVLIRNACHSGNLKLVRYLLETPGIKEHIKISTEKYKSFNEAIYSLNKELVFYLYDKYKGEMKEQYTYLDRFFRKAYKDNCFEYAKQLREHKEIENYFIWADKSLLLTELINQNRKEDIEYLFNEPKFHKSIRNALDYGSVMVSMSKANIEILHLIIVKNEIPLTETLKSFLENTNYDTETMKKLFSNRDLYQKLSENFKDLPKEKKHKI